MQIFKNNYVTIKKLTHHYSMNIINYNTYKFFWDTIINMLNVGYFKFNNTSNGVIKNNFQFGKAWYVSKLEKVKNPKSYEETMEDFYE